MTADFPELHPRQLQVMRLAAQGLGYRQIAHRLGISETTVRRHREAAIRALGAATTTQACAIVIERDTLARVRHERRRRRARRRAWGLVP